MFRVLLLDDDARFCRLLARSLEQNGDFPCAVTIATSAEEAQTLTAQAEQPFDIFLIDQRLGPGPDGIEVLQQLLHLSPESEAIVFTQINDSDAGIRAYRAGAYRYLHKPFTVPELVLVLRSLHEWRNTRRERDGLRVLTEIAEQLQNAFSIRAVSEIVVKKVVQFGFERARLWLFNRDGKTLKGIGQFGNQGLQYFEGYDIPVSEALYASKVIEAHVPIVFKGQEYGESWLYLRFKQFGYEAAQGDWVGLPLRTKDRCLGALMLDNHAEPRRIRREQLQELIILGQQVAAALDRARIYEREQRKNQELILLMEIGHSVANRAAIVDLDTLLGEVRSLVAHLIDVRNFMLVLYDEAIGRLDFRLRVERDIKQPRRYRSGTKGLIGYIIRQCEPVLLKSEEENKAFRKQERIELMGRPAVSWLGVPLLLENKAIGVLAVQSYEQTIVFTEEDRDVLQAVADQVAGAIQTARLKEEADRNNNRLSLLQYAGIELMQLAERQEEWFWHAALTIATAGYGLAFDRAMLFLSDESGTLLRGRLGIGELDRHKARESRKRNRWKDRSGFDYYLERLKKQQVPVTPVDEIVQQMVFHLSNDEEALRQALQERRRVLVSAEEVDRRLPSAFLEAFGRANYAVLPLLAGGKKLGVVVVDNVFTRQMLDATVLSQLETLLTQVALTYESLRQRRTSDQLIDVTHDVLANVATRTLKEVLNEICQAAQSNMRADCVLIYPFAPDSTSEDMYYDAVNTGYIGLQSEFRVRERPIKTGITAHVLRADKPLLVNDVARAVWHDGQELVKGSFLEREGIRSFIAAPIREQTTDTLMGVLYLNYRTLQSFDMHDKRRAHSFAQLAGAAILSSREGARLRASRDKAETQNKARGRELEELRQVLETALRPDVTSDAVARQLLEVARDLLGLRSTQVALILRNWSQPQNKSEDPTEVRQQYYLQPDGQLGFREGQQLYTGITGYVLSIGEDQCFGDVSETSWNERFVPRSDELIYANGAPTRSELDVLIKLEGQILGLFNVESSEKDAFSHEHHETLRRLAAVAALALDNVRRQAHLRNVLKAVEAITHPTSLEETLQAVLEAARQVAPGALPLTIWYIDPESDRIVSGLHFGIRDEESLHANRPDFVQVLKEVMDSPGPIWATSAHDISRYRERFVEDEAIESTAAFPLRTGEKQDEVVGAMFFNYRQRHEFTREEQVLFPILAAIAAVSIRDVLRLRALEHEQARLQAVKHITLAVGTTLDLDETLRRIMQVLKELFAAAKPCVLVYNDKKHVLEFYPASHDFYTIEDPESVALLKVDGDRHIACRVAFKALQSGEPVWENIGDVRNDPNYLQVNSNTESELCLALMGVERKRLIGVLVLESDRPNAFSDDDVELMKGIAPVVSLAIERAEQSEKLRFSTTVANFTAWTEEVAHDIKKEINAIRYNVYMLQRLNTDSNLQHTKEIENSASRLAAYSNTPQSAPREALIIDPWLQQQVQKMLEQRGGQADVERHFDLSCGELQVSVSALVLDRALRHLVRNALDAMEHKGRLTVRSMRKGNVVEVQIINTGPDIPPDVRDRLFKEQVSTKGKEGGMGLLFVRLAVEAMGGEVYLVSGSEGEVTFAFTVPIFDTPEMTIADLGGTACGNSIGDAKHRDS